MIYRLIFVLLFFPHFVAAATPSNSSSSVQRPSKKRTQKTDEPIKASSLMDRAKTELETKDEPTVKKNTATDNQVNGILILKDPLPPEAKSPFRLHFGVKISQWRPQGKVNVSGTEYQLSDEKSGWMPKLEFGIGSRDFFLGRVRTSMAARVEGGYLSQKSEFAFSSGNVPRNTYLNSMFYGYGLSINFGLDSFKNWGFELFPHVETFQYIQSSSTTDAEFNLSGAEYVLAMGPEYHMNENTLFFLQWSQTLARIQTQLPERASRAELGMRVQW